MSQPFDAAGKDLFETDPVAMAALLGVVRPAEKIHLVEAELSTVTAAADKVLRIEDESPWLLHVEIQSGYDASISRRMVKYNALLHDRHGLPVDSVLILLVPAADHDDLTGHYQYSGPHGPPWQFRYRVVRVSELDVETLMHGPQSLLPLAPIAKVPRREIGTILRAVVDRLQREASPDEANRLMTAVGIFLQLRYNSMTLGEELIDKIPEAKELPVFKKWIEEGIAKGKSWGLSQGLSQGRADGVRSTILIQGRKKFGKPSAKVEKALNAIVDQARLDALSERLLDVETWDELLQG